VNVALALYAAVLLPYFLGVHEDVEQYNPRAIQIGAFSGFVSFITYTVFEKIVWSSPFGQFGVG